MKKLPSLLGPLALSLACWQSPNSSAEIIQVTTPISANVTWRSTNEYVLNKFIYVLDGAILTIEAGTVIKAQRGQDADTSCLIVTTGGKIMAEGTRTRPIIFTSIDDDVTDPEDIGLFDRGLWGGLVVMGKAELNTASDVSGNAASPKYDVFEGLPDSQINGQFVHRYGGNDDNDSSGVLRYVSIRHAGVVFQPNKELNGLSLCAVGRGTVIEHVETYATADDGFEFFGGTVNTKYLVSAFNDDDAFDIDQGFRGKNQFWFSIQEPGKKDHGGEWNGEPNGIAVGASPVANYEIYNATFIGAGSGSSGNRGLTIREYASPKVYNSILTGFGGAAVRIDARSATHLSSGLLDLRENLFWDVAGVLAETAEAQVLFTETSRGNAVVDPQLRGISRTNDGGLDPRPMTGSPALSSVRTAPNDGFYTPVAFKGAFNSNDLWLSDWTFLAQAGFVRARGVNTIEVTQNISGAVTWYRTNEYVLNKFIYVLDGAILTIEAGTVIKAQRGQDADTSCLIVTAGGKIFAEGTARNPIIFTSIDDDVTDPEDIGLFDRGLWGGLVLMGKAELNTASDVSGNAASPKYDVFEGLPDSQINGQFVHRYGGNDDNDSSGVLRYVSIRHAGVVFQPNKELNGLSLCAVGRGTVIEHVETYATADDGFEFFGGTVNTKYLVSAFNDDDAFDIDQGFRGKNQFWFSIQEPGKKDHGGEWNGEPNGIAVGASPVANYEIYNATFIGAGSGSSGNRGLTIREYASPKVYNSILTGFGGAAVRIDAKSATHLSSGLLDLRENLFWDIAGVLAETAEAQVLFTETSRGNAAVDPQLRGISRTNDGGLDPRPMTGSPALSSVRTAPNDGFYTPVAFKGAFNAVNWVADWTAMGELKLISAAGAGTPNPLAPRVVPPAQLSISVLRNMVSVSFPSTAGVSYEVQSAARLGNDADWQAAGSTMIGAGEPLVFTTELGASVQFYRVISR